MGPGLGHALDVIDVAGSAVEEQAHRLRSEQMLDGAEEMSKVVGGYLRTGIRTHVVQRVVSQHGERLTVIALNVAERELRVRSAGGPDYIRVADTGIEVYSVRLRMW